MTFNIPEGFGHRLHLDYETGSEIDLKKCGAHKYAAHHSTRVLMLGWAVNDEPVELWEPHKNPEIPPRLLAFLKDPRTCKMAFNAQFERLITRHCLGIEIPYHEWRCTMVMSFYLAFAGGLDTTLKAIGLPPKDKRGGQLINVFCKPAPKNHKADWYDWTNKPSEWQEFCQYCITDVVVERQLYHWLCKFPQMNARDWQQWFLDQKINDRGVPMDVDMAKSACTVWDAERENLAQELRILTGLPKVTRDPFKTWLETQLLHPLDGMSKDYLDGVMRNCILDDDHIVRRAVELWKQKEGKAVSKYTAVINGAREDDRARGMFQYKGASRTDRVGGRLIQLQNLKRPFSDCDELQVTNVVNTLKTESANMIRMLYPQLSVSEFLGGSIRHVIKADEGKTFAIADLSSIESVVLGWIAQCPSIDATFREGKDTYKVFGEAYFRVAYEEVTKAQRSFSKPPVLGCFAADTKVLTRRGWMSIVRMTRDDELWDGVEWVSHDGFVYQGRKEVLSQYGVMATPEHKILCAHEWVRWDEVEGEYLDECLFSAKFPPESFPRPLCGPADCGRKAWPVEVGTYDILNAGPRNRFTILTSEGPVIAHNCGFMLGWKGLIAYAEGYGVDMTEEEAKRAVDTFRGMYPEIVDFWKWIYDAVKSCTASGQTITGYRMTIERDEDFLRIWLPSGRALSYYKPEVKKKAAPWSDRTMTAKANGATYEEFRSNGWKDEDLILHGYMQDVQWLDNFSYMGMNDKNQWVRIFCHAGGVTENIVQSLAGDILWNGLTNADKAGMDIVLHVHDEILVETPVADVDSTMFALEQCMIDKPAWAHDMWLGADSFSLSRYTKD